MNRDHAPFRSSGPFRSNENAQSNATESFSRSQLRRSALLTRATQTPSSRALIIENLESRRLLVAASGIPSVHTPTETDASARPAWIANAASAARPLTSSLGSSMLPGVQRHEPAVEISAANPSHRPARLPTRSTPRGELPRLTPVVPTIDALDSIHAIAPSESVLAIDQTMADLVTHQDWSPLNQPGVDHLASSSANRFVWLSSPSSTHLSGSLQRDIPAADFERLSPADSGQNSPIGSGLNSPISSGLWRSSQIGEISSELFFETQPLTPQTHSLESSADFPSDQPHSETPVAPKPLADEVRPVSSGAEIGTVGEEYVANPRPVSAAIGLFAAAWFLLSRNPLTRPTRNVSRHSDGSPSPCGPKH